MANWYLKSTAAGTAAGTSWANACTSVAQLLALGSPPAAGDSIWIFYQHQESLAASTTWQFAGSSASPNFIYSTNDVSGSSNASTPPAASTLQTMQSSTGLITSGNFSNITLTIGGYFYCLGVNIVLGNNNAVNAIELALNGDAVNGGLQIYDTCRLGTNNPGVIGFINVGAVAFNGANVVKMKSCTLVNNNTGVGAIQGMASLVIMENCKLETPLANIAPNLISATFNAQYLNFFVMSGCDWTAMGSTPLFGNSVATVIGQLINCKRGSGAISATPTAINGSVFDEIISSNSNVNYNSSRVTTHGTMVTSTAVTNSATDGTQAVSWSCTTNSTGALCSRQYPFELPPISQWVDATGTYANSTIMVTSDINTMTNADVWVELQVMDQSGSPLSDLITSAPASVLAAGSNLSTGGTWVTSAKTNKYILAIPSFTVQKKGYIRATVKIGKSAVSANPIFVDPVINVVP